MTIRSWSNGSYQSAYYKCKRNLILDLQRYFTPECQLSTSKLFLKAYRNSKNSRFSKSMRTSRISRETARIVSRGSNNRRSSFSRPQTRSLATSLQAFTAVASPCQDISAPKTEINSEDESSLSSINSTAILDIEDIASPVFPAQKRKRELDLTGDAPTSHIRASPRKPSNHTGNEIFQKSKKQRRQPAKKTVNEAGEVEIQPPATWGEVYEAVKEMRKSVLAPVDTMGCETLAEERLSPRVRVPYEFLRDYLTCSRINAFRR